MAMNREAAEYTLAIIRAVMKESAVPGLPEGIDLGELFAFARFHNVEALLWHGLSQLEMPEDNPVWQFWQNRGAMLLAQGVVQLSERDILIDALTSADIPVLPVKGCWIKELYPNLEYRQMADLDMLIPEECLPKATSLMLTLGYTTDTAENAPNHASFLKPPYTEVELHVKLLEEDRGYYADVWQRAQPVEDVPGLFRFRKEDEYIYYFLHMQKHLEDAGAGIRSVLDSLIYRTAWPDMDWAYLRQELEKWDLWELAQNIQRLCDCWFVTGEPVQEDLHSMAEAFLTSGSYGTVENRSQNRLAKLEKTYKSPLIRGVVYWAIQVFRPMEEMKRGFPVLKKAPFLLPVFWAYRAVRKFANRPGEIWHHITIVFGKGTKK